MEIAKNMEYVVDIIDMGTEGEGICKLDDFVVFVKGAITGEKVKIVLTKVDKNYGYGKMLEIIEKSPYRTEELCKSYKLCGGCSLQHITYEMQLKYKMEQVKNNFRKNGLDENLIKEIIGMKNPNGYRNKAQYPFGYDKNGKIVTGFYANRTHDIIENTGCVIESEISKKILNYVYNYVINNKISVYNEKNGKGYLRHLVIKVGNSTNEVMVVFVTNSDRNELKGIEEEIIKEFTEIKTIVQNINKENSNVILGLKEKILYGSGYIQDKLDKYVFNISAQSFYQVNPVQMKALYNKAKEYIGIADTLFDLYCGIGTIGIYVSDICKQVYSIEIVEQAINDANENAKINNINNIQFLCGKSEEKIDELYEKNIKADCIVVDPPRKGLDEKLINTIIDKLPEKIVYISCNNATMVRDINLLKEKYVLKECTLVDMFPYTSHVECVVLMSNV